MRADLAPLFRRRQRTGSPLPLQRLTSERSFVTTSQPLSRAALQGKPWFLPGTRQEIRLAGFNRPVRLGIDFREPCSLDGAQRGWHPQFRPVSFLVARTPDCLLVSTRNLKPTSCVTNSGNGGWIQLELNISSSNLCLLCYMI